MKIAIIAPGSRGDVQPYVALGKGLQDAGHAVSILAYDVFRGLVTDYSLEFIDLGGSLLAVMDRLQAQLERGQMLQIMASMSRTAQKMSAQAAASGLIACQGSDVIMAGLGGLFVGQALSEKLGLPLIQAHLLPFTPTGEFPGALMPPPPRRLPGWANRLTHRLTQQILWQTYRVADNQARANVLRITPAPFFGPFTTLAHSPRAILYGYSPLVLPRPKDWDARIIVTGYWFLDPPAGWKPPADLVSFLLAGPPPVYIGFGSMPSRKPEQTADLVLQALARTGQRGVLSAGWGGLKKENLPDTVFMVGSLPHRWLFPRMAAIVHHGGVGTTAAALAAGVPAVVTPFFGDQPFWGQRVYALGVGPRPIPRQRLTIDKLADGIRSAVSDTAMRKRAADLGQRIRAEDAIARAVAAIEQA